MHACILVHMHMYGLRISGACIRAYFGGRLYLGKRPLHPARGKPDSLTNGKSFYGNTREQFFTCPADRLKVQLPEMALL